MHTLGPVPLRTMQHTSSDVSHSLYCSKSASTCECFHSFRLKATPPVHQYFVGHTTAGELWAHVWQRGSAPCACSKRSELWACRAEHV